MKYLISRKPRAHSKRVFMYAAFCYIVVKVEMAIFNKKVVLAYFNDVEVACDQQHL